MSVPISEKKPIDQIDLAFNETQALALRIVKLSERLTGFGMVEEEEIDEVAPVGDINRLIDRSSIILNDISGANRALDHLEKII